MLTVAARRQFAGRGIIAVQRQALAQASPIGGILWMGGAALFFSMSMGFVRYLSDYMTTFEIVFLRQAIGVLLMLPWVMRAGAGGLRTRRLPLHVGRALLGYTGMLLSYFSLRHIPLADSTALQFTLPLFTTILAIVFLGERVGVHRWAAIAFGFAGVLIIAKPGFAVFSIGMVFALGSAAFYGGTDIVARALSRTDATNLIVFLGFLLPLPVAAIPAAFEWTTPAWEQAPAILGFGVAASSASWCLTRSLSLADASLVSPVLFLRLPFVAAIGFVFFGQVTDVWTWAGAGIIFAGTYVLARREAAASRARA